MSDTTTISDTKISHPNVRALNKWSSFSSTTCSHHPQLKPAILHLVDDIMARVKVREVKNHDRESRIQQAIEERTKKGTGLRDLALLYKILRSTLSDRLRGIPSRHEAQREHRDQVISLAVERSLIRWANDMDASGFPPRLDLFKATAARLVSEEGALHSALPG